MRFLVTTVWSSTSTNTSPPPASREIRTRLWFQTAVGKTGALTGKALWQQDAYRMIQRRTRGTGIKTRIGNHTFRATGITAYLKNKGTLEAAQHIANHESPRTTKALRPAAHALSTRSARSMGSCSAAMARPLVRIAPAIGQVG